MNRRLLLVSVAATLLAGAPAAVPLFSPWSRINCVKTETDITSGRQRSTRFLYWIPVSRRIKETPLSRAVAGQAKNQPPQWRPNHTSDPYQRHSPHHAYHSATHQILTLKMIWEATNADANERARTGQGLLHAWQSATNDRPAGEYLNRLGNQASPPNKTTSPASASPRHDQVP